MKTVASIGLFTLLAALVSAHAEGLTPWQAERPPRLRIAASPYQDWLVRVVPTNADFGQHLYRVRIDTLGLGPSSELSRGHFYTRRGGFLDLSHIRRAVDFAAYVHYQVRECLRHGETHFAFESIDRTTYHGDLSYPADWGDLASGARERLIGELAIRAGVEAAIDFSNWREILTWHGFHNVPGMPEQGSAFSFEDVPSHSVGAAVAERALRASGTSFDEAVTRELARELEDLGIVPEETYRRAMALTEDRWWGNKTCLKRHLDTGLDDGWIEPWLVRGLEPGPPPRARRYRAPSRDYRDVLGHDCRGLIVLSCEPHPRRRAVRERVLPEGAAKVIPARDYPAMLERIRREMIAELGPRVTVAWP